MYDVSLRPVMKYPRTHVMTNGWTLPIGATTKNNRASHSKKGVIALVNASKYDSEWKQHRHQLFLENPP